MSDKSRVKESPAAPRGSFLTQEIIAGATQILDFAAVLLAAAAAFLFYILPQPHGSDDADRYALTAFAGAAFLLAGLRWLGCYNFRRLTALQWQLPRVVVVWFGVVALLLMLAFFAKISIAYSRVWALGWTIAALALLVIERAVLFSMIKRWSRRGYLTRGVVVVGAGEQGERIIEKLRATPGEGIAIIGVFDDRKSRLPPMVAGCEILGTTDDLLQFGRHVRIDEIIVSLPLAADQRFKELIDKLRSLPVDLRLSVEPLSQSMPVRGLSHTGDVPVLEIVERPLKQWSAVYKWAEDKMLGALLLAVSAPFMLLIAIAIKLDSRGPILFSQERFGFNNRVIRVLKFRTMFVEKGDPGGAQRTVRNDPRVTRVGRILRGFSLDELPQLINVVKGEMSLVGPRPHAVAMRAGDSLYHDAVAEYAERHRVKPGITGWAQVNGLRGEIDTEEKARQRVIYDLKYIEDWSVGFDLMILFLSIPTLLKRENAY